MQGVATEICLTIRYSYINININGSSLVLGRYWDHIGLMGPLQAQHWSVSARQIGGTQEFGTGGHMKFTEGFEIEHFLNS